MKLSILDQAPVYSGGSAKDALENALSLAQVAEKCGYTRYWIAEHHDLSGLACSAPEVMLSYIGANTNSLRIGSGAVLLPYYRPYKVAEVYHTLATLFPDRIDIGIGRAPGGSAEATNALSDHFLQQVWKMPELIDELLSFIHRDFPDDHPFAHVTAAPFPNISPKPWLLGTSKKSALLAAEKGMSYNFGQFMSDHDGKEIIGQYVENFKPRRNGDKREVIVTVSVLCAETIEKADKLAASWYVWGLQREKGEGSGIPTVDEAMHYLANTNDKNWLEKIKKKVMIGNPIEVKKKLIEIKDTYQADEIMIMTMTGSHEERLESYENIARVCLK